MNRRKPMANNHVWVIEAQLIDGSWRPAHTGWCAFISRAEAIQERDFLWGSNLLVGKLRIRKYIREESNG